MYHCPRCHCELPIDARFCTTCGLYSTEIETVSSSFLQLIQELSQPAHPPTQLLTDAVPPSPPQQAPRRVVQPTVKYIPPVRPRPSPRKGPGLPLGPSQPSERTASRQEHTSIPTSEPQQGHSEQNISLAHIPLKQGDKPGLTRPIEIKVPSRPRSQPSTFLSSLPSRPVQEPQHPTDVPTQSLRLDDTHTSAPTSDATGAESIAATKRAAEHWRKSWRDRQRAEAGPALSVSRGQAPVPEPLLAMQHTLQQMRAILMPTNKPRQPSGGREFGFWVTLVLMLILLSGLGAYLLSPYLLGKKSASQLPPPVDGPQPTLTLVGTNTSTFIAGRPLHVHGEHFGVHDTITFVLDTETLNVSVQSTSQGTFDVSIPIPSHWLAGAYALEAQDTHADKHAFLDIQVLPDTTTANTTALVLEDARGAPLTSLTFTAVISKGDPQEQLIHLRNTSTTPIQWTVSAMADKNLSWLLVNDGTTGDTLKARGTFDIGVSVTTAGLPVGSYTGHIIFTVASQGQVILPVTLTIVDATVEVVVTPNPIFAVIQHDGTCQPSTLTLVNLSDTVVVHWAVKGDSPSTQQHIALNGKPEANGDLLPSEQGENSVALKIGCVGVQLGTVYRITVYYNNMQVHIPIIIGQPY